MHNRLPASASLGMLSHLALVPSPVVARLHSPKQNLPGPFTFADTLNPLMLSKKRDWLAVGCYLSERHSQECSSISLQQGGAKLSRDTIIQRSRGQPGGGGGCRWEERREEVQPVSQLLPPEWQVYPQPFQQSPKKSDLWGS